MEWQLNRFTLLFKILFVFIYSLLSFKPTSAYAATAINLQHLSFSDLKSWMPVTLQASQGNKELSLTSPDLSLIESHVDLKQIKHSRMQQVYQGFPVLGGYAILHQHSQNGLRSQELRMNGRLYQGLSSDLGQQPSWFLSKAKDLLAHYRAQFPSQDQGDAEIKPVIYVTEANQAVWAYQVAVQIEADHGSPRRPTAILAAEDERVLVEWDDLHSVTTQVHGKGFGGNIKIGKYQFGKDRPLLNLLRDEESGQCFFENKNLRIVDMQHRSQHENIPMSFDCGESLPSHDYWTGYTADGYDRVNGAYSIANDAMYWGQVVKDMYRKRYHQEVLVQNGLKPMQLLMRIHYGNLYANAFWDGYQMSFGDGDNQFYPLISLGITAHELSHGFTQQHSGLVYYGQAGGMNESFSDMAAQAAEYYLYGKPSWVIGADILKENGALRFLAQPSRDGKSIDNAGRYQTGMDVHFSSGVYNHFFYDLAHRPGWDPQKAFAVMIKANMDYWTPTSSFAEGACGVLSAADELGFDQDDVMLSFDAVMIDYGDC